MDAASPSSPNAQRPEGHGTPGQGVALRGAWHPDYAAVLTPEALEFVAKLARTFGARREALLERRKAVQAAYDKGERPRFLPETKDIRESEWTVAPLPADLLDRRVEITGPVDRKMIINALNSGANVFMADFEDANAPTWDNLIAGQLNLLRRGARHHQLHAPTTASTTRSTRRRPCSWCGRAAGTCSSGTCWSTASPCPARSSTSASTSSTTRARCSSAARGPYFYLPKMESHLEARLWNDVFVLRPERARHRRAAPSRPPCSSRRCPRPSRWTRSSTSCASTRRASTAAAGTTSSASSRSSSADPTFVLPDRGQVTMDKAFLRAYSQLLIQTCHRRGVHAMGGMAAQIPIKDDPAANEAALAKVRADKLREVQRRPRRHLGRPPGPRAGRARDLRRAHARARTSSTSKRDDVRVTEADLLAVPEGTRTEDGPAPQHPRGRPVPRRLARRPGLRAALQPDGGRGHRGDLPRPGVAVDPPPRAARRRPARHRGALPPGARRGDGAHARPRAPPSATAPSGCSEARALFEQLSHRAALRGVPHAARLRGPDVTTAEQPTSAARPWLISIDRGAAHVRRRDDDE